MRALLTMMLLAGCTVAPQAGGGGTVFGGESPSLDRLDQSVHREGLVVRGSNDVAELDGSDQFAGVYRRDTVRWAYFGYVAFDGKNAFDQVRRAGVTYQAVSGNLYETTPQRQIQARTANGRTVRSVDWWESQVIARKTVAGWLESSGYRWNVLRLSQVRHEIAVASRSDRVVITQVLC